MTDTNESTFDFMVFADQSIAVVTPNNAWADDWLSKHTSAEQSQLGRGIAVELRYIRDLCNGILDAGFTITKDGCLMVRRRDGELILELSPGVA